ncbi:hypothetical protein B2J93_8984 [Marssonina coronariae]|uniref:Fms interacting protein n=1 Tax=Diplocarpon coronariae TaxID=2795749 RepID=A0A218ZI82_9HELO|nr:hypothetical protein B2J93_8984 [Marssonina coronariae]
MTPKEIVTDPSLQLALSASADAQAAAVTLLDFVSSAPSTSSTSHEFQIQVSKQRKLLLAYLAQLRGLHRDAHLSARETKAVTAEARQEVDKLHLQLQNLYYEQRHLQGEIEACESYECVPSSYLCAQDPLSSVSGAKDLCSHKYLALPLIPVEEFIAQFPQYADADEVALMTARIEHEYAERQELESQRKAMLVKKQMLTAANTKRKDQLANLDKDLEKFIDAAKPIQNTFGQFGPFLHAVQVPL